MSILSGGFFDRKKDLNPYLLSLQSKLCFLLNLAYLSLFYDKYSLAILGSTFFLVQEQSLARATCSLNNLSHLPAA